MVLTFLLPPILFAAQWSTVQKVVFVGRQELVVIEKGIGKFSVPKRGDEFSVPKKVTVNFGYATVGIGGIGAVIETHVGAVKCGALLPGAVLLAIFVLWFQLGRVSAMESF